MYSGSDAAVRLAYLARPARPHHLTEPKPKRTAVAGSALLLGTLEGKRRCSAAAACAAPILLRAATKVVEYLFGVEGDDPSLIRLARVDIDDRGAAVEQLVDFVDVY